MFEICNPVPKSFDLGHLKFEVSDSVTAYCLVGVDDVAPLFGKGPGSCQVTTTEVPGDKSDYGRIIHYKEHMFFLGDVAILHD